MLSDMDRDILIQTIADYSIELSGVLNMPLNDFKSWLTIFCDQLNTTYINCGAMVVAFVFKTDFISSIELSYDNLNSFAKSGKEVVCINLDHKLTLCSDLLSADELEISKYGEVSKNVVFRLEGEILKIYMDGRLGKRINIAHPLSVSEVRFSKNSRSCKDYKLVIEDHRKMRLINIMDTYWSDKKNRILKGGRTEDIFQQSLFEWFQLHIHDGHTKIETKTNAGDRTDIDIYAFLTGQHYVIEVKWLGINEHNTSYDADRIIAGIGQIKTYLEREPINEAYLTCYDGRPEEEHITNSHVEETLVPPKGDYTIIFLESESASKKGEQYANRSKLES